MKRIPMITSLMICFLNSGHNFYKKYYCKYIQTNTNINHIGFTQLSANIS